MAMGTQQRQPIDTQKFSAVASKLDKQSLANLVNQARQQGISEDEIEAGLNFLLKLR
jgi:DNA-binding transcriptional regulator YhcF (GntR family)